ncbi:MAG: gamma-glutamyl-gamma-aminobutyrate hydrolase family protein [Clostridia bacterium]|nr:gamma-glutamyl-gamma-aminobutyrate hydrolase family protein [Clostridia bacterium]
MPKLRPLIGITPWYNYEDAMTYIKKGYCEGINQAGGMAVLLPLSSDEEFLNELMNRCDGFLLSGGPDVDARTFGEENTPYNGNISPYRDAMELYIARRAVELNIPIFGICRGIQVMNVAMGGTLYQDIYTQNAEKKMVKHTQDAPKWYPTHEIRIKPNSKVWTCFKEEVIGVNSFHHQAIKDLAADFEVTSTASDGIIESIEHKSHVFAVGVQWHPELMWQEDERFLKLFKAFVNCCR